METVTELRQNRAVTAVSKMDIAAERRNKSRRNIVVTGVMGRNIAVTGRNAVISPSIAMVSTGKATVTQPTARVDILTKIRMEGVTTNPVLVAGLSTKIPAKDMSGQLILRLAYGRGRFVA